MLNRVGQRLLQLFEGASAAYSLRDLASNIASVVRVRRASDNSEKDFSAADVSSGAMTQWVNAQIVPPLDVRELVDGERTGALIPAAAAYSLRNLSTSYTGNVVDVRRSSDDAEDSFTAAEVADGTLTDWVNTDLGITFETAEPTTSGATVTNASSTGFTYSSSSTGVRGARIPFSQSIPAGAEISITLTVSNEVGSMTPSVRLASDSSSQLAASATPSTFTSDASGTQTFVGTTTSTTTSLAFFDNVVGSFDVSNVTINYIRYNGHVTQWYDQSGNANHATQGTNASQPKIVDAGTLVSGGLDFDGVDDFLPIPPLGQDIGSLSSFCAGSYDASSANTDMMLSLGTTTGSKRWYSPFTSGASTLFGYGASGSAVTVATDTNANIYTAIAGSTQGNYSAFINGDIKGTASLDSGATSGVVGIGGMVDSTSFPLDGKVSEVIIYPSDQSDNRTAFEANIGETYGIDLPSGVDTGYDQVDGFVETWYDQSGNGNDAVQATAGSQPKIVDAGVLVSGGIDFDGVDDHLGLSGSGLDIFKDAGYGQVFTAITPERTASGSTRYFEAITGTTGARVLLGDSQEYASSSRIGGRRLDSDSFQDIESSTSHGNNETLVTGFLNWADSDAYLYFNGTQVASSTSFQTDGNTSDTSSVSVDIGGVGNHGNFKMQELIIYTSDQSANRAAIETNINNQYDIY